MAGLQPGQASTRLRCPTRYNHPRSFRSVTRTLPPTRTLLLLLAGLAAAASAQTPAARPATPPVRKPKRIRPAPPPFNPSLIVLDPAHGGSDDGANLGSAGLEKDLTVAFADRLRTLLTDKGFTVVLTHDSSDVDINADQRVELANRSRAVACLLLHASNAGHGIHLYTSSMTAPSTFDASVPANSIAPWDSAQATALPRSLQLVNELATTMTDLRVPLIVGRASVRPIDSMSCAAVAIEITPASAESTLADDPYQQRIAESIVLALTAWRDQAQVEIAAQGLNAQAAESSATQAAAATSQKVPAAKPKPKTPALRPPEEVPLAPAPTVPTPAPIVRRPPPTSTTPPPPGARQTAARQTGAQP